MAEKRGYMDVAREVVSSADPEELAVRAYENAKKRGLSQEQMDQAYQSTYDASDRAMNRGIPAAAKFLANKAQEYYNTPSNIPADALKVGSSLIGGMAAIPGFYFGMTNEANAGEKEILERQMWDRIRQQQEQESRARGGRLLQDQYPTHYLPHVGRQVMNEGGTPDDPVNKAMAMVPKQNDTVSLARSVLSSPSLAETFKGENQPGVIVSPRPGKGSGPVITPEKGLKAYDPEAVQKSKKFEPKEEGRRFYNELNDDERQPWTYATPNILGAALPPPVQHPVFNEPRMAKITKAAGEIFKKKEFQKLVKDMTGLEGLKVMPTVGTYMGEKEPSFIIQHPDMTSEHAENLAHLLGFGFQQDSVIHNHHNPDLESGIPNLLIGSQAKLSAKKIDQIHDLARQKGLDFTVTADGKAAKFMHFGGDESVKDFIDTVNGIADAAQLPERYHAKSEGQLKHAQTYLPFLFGSAGGGEGVQTGSERSPDLFRRIVNHVLAPYAKAVAGEGYRLSPERLQKAYGLTDEETDHVRNALYPTGKKSEDRTTVPLMNGDEELDVRPTGERNSRTVGDVLYALQNRAARLGQIDPGDFSDKAKQKIADAIAHEVSYHVKNSDKSAIGWYDQALKKAMGMYGGHFDELADDPDKQMLFHGILGITSQGNDVYANSLHAVRLYKLMQDKGIALPEAIKQLKGTFGDKTRAIETNLQKFHELLDKNGFDKMRELMNSNKTVSEWNKILRTDPAFKIPGSDNLEMKGGKDQKVTGWMVFGPKIGSFINNLHGDYSTLTADLWFSRTWNRLLGHNFIHTPIAEAKQYRDLRDAMKAEWDSHNAGPYAPKTPKTTDGKIREGSAWLHGTDLKDMDHEEFQNLINDPDAMLEFAQDATEKYRKSGFKQKSDVRRRAKNWIENRELSVAAPRSSNERSFQQDTIEHAQDILRKKYGMDISVADIQAALWFHEKELFGKLGVASEKAQPADYADAAAKTIQRINDGSLYQNKTKEKKKKKPSAGFVRDIQEEEEHKLDDGYAEGGTVHKPHQRAEEQGYSIKGFHVTRGDRARQISSAGRFDLEHALAPGENAAFFWDNSDAANDWAHATADVKSFDPQTMSERDLDRVSRHKTSILPVRINPGKHQEVDWPSFSGKSYYDNREMAKLISQARDKGIDTLRIKNMQEDEYREQPHDQIAVLSPRLIRSEYAQFDPQQAHKDDLGANRGGEVN
jgi:hypothetical protein